MLSQKDASKVFLRQPGLSQPKLSVNYTVLEPTAEDTFKTTKYEDMAENDFRSDVNQLGRLIIMAKDGRKIAVASFAKLQKMLQVYYCSTYFPSFFPLCLYRLKWA